jgi:hypothetical protein
MNKEQKRAVQAIDDYFKSGNSVPVSRATIKREEWELAKAAFASQAKSVPDGWKLVPIDITPKMIWACSEQIPFHMGKIKHAYEAILAAAPQPPTDDRVCELNDEILAFGAQCFITGIDTHIKSLTHHVAQPNETTIKSIWEAMKETNQ